MRIELENHGPDEATLHVLPTLWFRNTWSCGRRRRAAADRGRRRGAHRADHRLAGYRLEAAPGPDGVAPEALFCENETNAPRVFGSEPTTPYPKDGINDHVVSGAATVNPDGFGTKAALRYRVTVAGGRQGRAAAAAAPARRATPAPARLGGRCRSTTSSPRARSDADEFYAALAPPDTAAGADADPAAGVRRARLEQADVPVQRRAAGSTATRASRRRRSAPPRPQQRLAAPRLVRRARDAGPVGVPVVRGLGPRVPLRPLGAPRSRVREVPAGRAAARVVPAPERRASGLRVELRRRQPAGARHGGAARVPHRRRHATASSSSASSRSCSSTSPGGSTARTPTATTSSAAASSGSTTSARSTARTCPRA